ncbi:MAG: Gfo/Idh/MocA family oxidoreductase [Chloroflexi bacterium]|nr:Gfo/Idh/MocA family oxidoreductase [Chloroflexota bacterium]
MAPKVTRMILVGAGDMARHHIRQLLQQRDTTRIVALCEPSAEQYKLSAQVFREAGVRPPPNEPDLEKLVSDRQGAIDAAFIITPHALHHDQTALCMEAGLDVLLEKPMVMNAAEARSLIETRDRTGRLLTVAFQSALSPYMNRAVEWIRGGEAGTVTAIHASVWQSWKTEQTGTWRQNPAMSGGGFLFDTGAHMLNSIVRLGDADFTEVAAWMDNRGAPVDILTSAMGRLSNGVLVTIGACGETVTTCAGDIKVFGSRMIINTDMWGSWLKVQRQGRPRFASVKLPPQLGVWQQFLAVRRGEIGNPSPPELGLRLALLWDAIQASARQGGKPVAVPASN